MALKRFASINVGSFETGLGIYEADPGKGLRRIDSMARQLPLGTDTYTSGAISFDLAEELFEVLTDFMALAREYRCEHVTALATSAMREAENAPLILDQIRVHTGLNVQVISNAELRLLSCCALPAMSTRFEELIREGTAIVDLGYGSMQITLYDEGRMVGTQNLPLGALRIREALGRLTSASDERTRIVSELVDHELELYRSLHLRGRKIRNVIAIGDLVRMLFDRLVRRDGRDPDKERMTRLDRFLEGYRYVLSRTDMELEDRLGVTSETASLMIPGAIIYYRVLELLGAEQVWFPGTQLVDGIAADYAFRKKLLKNPHDFSADVISAVEEIAKRYGEDTVHRAYSVANTLKIFDAVHKDQGFTDRDRLLIQIAALLHHCGRFVNMAQADRSSYDIIHATEIVGLSAEEHELVCAVFRCGSGRRPNLREIPMKAAKFAALISLADSLDRSAKQKGGDIRVRMDEEDRLVISTKSSSDMTLERLNFDLQKSLFRDMFGIEPVFRQKRAL